MTVTKFHPPRTIAVRRAPSGERFRDDTSDVLVNKILEPAGPSLPELVPCTKPNSKVELTFSLFRQHQGPLHGTGSWLHFIKTDSAIRINAIRISLLSFPESCLVFHINLKLPDVDFHHEFFLP
jgi:hypothetical protein